MATNEDDDNDLPQAVDLRVQGTNLNEVQIARAKRRSPKPSSKTRSMLDQYEAAELSAMMTPFIRRLPDESGELPYPPRLGTAEFVDPAMTEQKLLDLITPSLKFSVTISNIKGTAEVFFGKLVNVPRYRGMRPQKPGVDAGAITALEDRITSFEARLAVIEEKFPKVLTTQSKVIAKLNTMEGRLDGQQRETSRMDKELTTVANLATRVDKESVKKVDSALTKPAYSVTQPVVATTEKPATKLQDIRDRRSNRLKNFRRLADVATRGDKECRWRVMQKRKAKPWIDRPLTRGKMVLPPGEKLPVDIVAPPRSEAEYQLAKRRLLNDLYGDSIAVCRHCRWPMLRGYNCRTCNGEQ